MTITSYVTRQSFTRVTCYLLSIVQIACWVSSLTVLAGCAGSIKRKVAKGIESSLPEIIGPAASYEVSVFGSTTQMLRHRLSRIDITGKDVHLPKGLEISRLDVSLNDVEFDPGKRTITRSSGATYLAVLSEQQLERYLRKVYPSIPGLGITLEDGRVVARASPSLIGLTAAINAEARLQVRDNKKLVLDITRVTAAGVPAPGFAREYIENKLNPVFDASDLGYDATISSLSIKPGRVTIAGTLDLTKVR